MIKNKYSTLITFIFCVVCLFKALPQQRTIDSLKTLAGKAKNDSEFVILNLNISRTFNAINFDSCLFYAKRALNYSKSKKQNRLVGASYKFLGKVYAKKSDYNQAISYYRLSLEVYNKTNDKLNIGDCYHSIGNMQIYLGDYTNALQNYYTAVKYNEEVGNKERVANAFANIGVIQMRQKSYKQAIETYNKNLKIYNQLNDSDGVITCYKNLGVIYGELRENEKALDYYFKCLKLEEINPESGTDIVATYNDIGNVYLNQHKLNDAIIYWNKAYKLLENSDNVYGKFYCYTGLGAAYVEKKEFAKGLEFMNKAKEVAGEAGLKYETMDLHRNLADAYVKVNDFKNAYENERLHSDLNDSIHNEENSKAIAEMQSKYESEKKDKELLKQDAALKQQALENERKAVQRNFLIAGFVLMGLLAFFIFRGYRNKQKSVVEISKQKKIIEEKNKDITDSINYAKRIQEVILPPQQVGSDWFAESFIFYRPKDVVSGDFYWYNLKNNHKIITAVDCTGHGVPGALMSMIGFSFLNEVVNDKGLTQPDLILSNLRDKVKASLKQTGEIGESKDGMDMALLSFNNNNSQVQFCGAHNPLWHFRKSGDIYNFTEYKADKRPVGYYMGKSLPFTNTVIDLQKGDTLYIFTDGFADQFGGPKGKKFKYSQLKDLLDSIQALNLSQQKEKLFQAFDTWKGEFEQVDDVLIIGIRV